MRLIELKFLSNYKMFPEGSLIKFSAEPHQFLDSDLNFSVLVGRNGSGKTTIMSLLVNIFHHLERYKGKIEPDFVLKYSIFSGVSSKEVTLSKSEEVIRVSVEGFFDDVELIPRKGPKENDYQFIKDRESAIEYSIFHSFTPMRVVTSVFSMHGEYPGNRPHNYKGHRSIDEYNIKNIYGKNHFELEGVSRGIRRFINLAVSDHSKLESILEVFELKFNYKVLIKNALDDDEEWFEVDDNWIEDFDIPVQFEEYYLNDLSFIRNGRELTFSNMSAGEKMLLLRLISLLSGIEKGSLLILEEPELHLDQIWNKHLVSLFYTIFDKYNSHLLIATHDLSLIKSVPNTNILNLASDKEYIVMNNTFLSNNNSLREELYGEKGVELNKLEESILKQITSPETPMEKLIELDNLLGESVYKFLLKKRLRDK